MASSLQEIAHSNATITPVAQAGAKPSTRSRALEVSVVGVASTTALLLGLVNNGAPSYWHDELVHVFAGTFLADYGKIMLPSTEPYYNGTVFHLILGGVYELFGNSEAVMRTPSAVFAAVNVILVYLVIRPMLGPRVALVAAVGMALSPWNVAWSREARFYTLHQGLYIGFIGLMWHVATETDARRLAGSSVFALLVFAAGLLTSFHALIFLAVPGVYAVVAGVHTGESRKRWVALLAGLGVAGVLAIVALRWLMNPVDRAAIIENGGLGGELVFAERSSRFYYLMWLAQNLSRGFLLLALVGTAWMLFREGRRGLFVAFAFWVPLTVLTFLVGYRWPKFLFFAYPFFIVLWSYALVRLGDWILRPKPGWASKLAAALLALFFVRLGVSAFRLTGDSVEAASGANISLAARHPQWRAPCDWVRDRLRPDTAVIATTFLPVFYYVGRVDTWYPTRALPAEAFESGLEGIDSTNELARFIRDHPHGFFIAEWWRFERNYARAPWADFSEDIAWVQSHMRRIDAASTEDVTVYAWGDAADL